MVSLAEDVTLIGKSDRLLARIFHTPNRFPERPRTIDRRVVGSLPDMRASPDVLDAGTADNCLEQTVALRRSEA